MNPDILTPEQPEWEAFYLTLTRYFTDEHVGKHCKCVRENRRHTHEILKLFPRFSVLRTMQYLQYHGGTCDCRVRDIITLIEATRGLQLKQAAEKGDIAAQVAFALLCLNGTLASTMGKEERTFVSEGVDWLKKACGQGSVPAALILKGQSLSGVSYAGMSQLSI